MGRGNKLSPSDKPPWRTVLAAAAVTDCTDAEGDSRLAPTGASAGADRGAISVAAIAVGGIAAGIRSGGLDEEDPRARGSAANTAGATVVGPLGNSGKVGGIAEAGAMIPIATRTACGTENTYAKSDLYVHR